MKARLDWWPSPAKINLFLHINGRLANGYHQLQSLFQLLDYGDQLRFEVQPNKDIQLKQQLADVSLQDNLIYRAARLLQENTACALGCTIELKKVLPMGGGIGGGSSNAATTLVALNHLWELNLSVDTLAEIGLSLGADVPVFVRGKSAFAEGVGEQIYPVELHKQCYLVVFPNCHVSTADVFQAPELPRNSAPIAWSEYTFESTRNDCQSLVCKGHPKVANLLQRLLEYAPSRMTGTGASIFSLFNSEEDAQKVLKSLPKDCVGFVAKGVNESPLLTHLTKVKNAQTTAII